MSRSPFLYSVGVWALGWFLWAARGADGQLDLRMTPGGAAIRVQGNDADDEWRFQFSYDLARWTNAPGWGTAFSGASAAGTLPAETELDRHGFVRAVRTTGLFDTNVFRILRLTFTNANWATLLAAGRTTGSNVVAALELENGVRVAKVGARYKGNSSYQLGGNKKSVNLDINWPDPDARVMGYRAINLNNAAGDETLLREPLYFNVMREYAPSPSGAMARLEVNGADRGVYSMVDQINNDLLDEWFPSHEGDRWRAPNIGGAAGGGRPGGGGGGGFGGGGSAFTYLGTNVARYRASYELKSQQTTNAWERLIRATDVLNNTPTNQLRDQVEEVFAVDRWLWFLAVENIFVDDDSYWYKGADFAFYYEPESGRIHPVEHDGNEAFTAAGGINFSLTPVQGANDPNRPLLFRLLRINELRQRYLAHMRTVLQETFNPTVITPRIEHFHQLTVAAVIKDPLKNFSMAGSSNDLRALRTYVTNRYRFLTNHAELLPAPPSIVAVSEPMPPPGPAEPAWIMAKVAPAEGLDSVWLYWRDKPYGRFSVRQMFDDGGHQDGDAGDGLFGAATTNYPAGQKIHYYVEARAAKAPQAAAFAPARAEEQTFSYQVALVYAGDSAVLINELMADNESAVADSQGDFDDWIELRNVSDDEIDLTGLYLTDNPSNPRKWAFPEGTIIPPQGYLIVWADDDEGDSAGLHASFRLSADGEELYLIDRDAANNAVLDSVRFDALPADWSYGRSPIDPSRFVLLTPSPNGPN